MKIKLKEGSSVEIANQAGDTIAKINEDGTIEGLSGGTKLYLHVVSFNADSSKYPDEKACYFRFVSYLSNPVDNISSLSFTNGVISPINFTLFESEESGCAFEIRVETGTGLEQLVLVGCSEYASPQAGYIKYDVSNINTIKDTVTPL